MRTELLMLLGTAIVTWSIRARRSGFAGPMINSATKHPLCGFLVLRFARNDGALALEQPQLLNNR